MGNQRYIIKIAETKEELEQYYSLRRDVFVKEQKLFAESDRDQYDAYALPIIAKATGSGLVVGTARCYPVAENVWVGGRLTVCKTHWGGLGSQLVRGAVKIMRDRGCRDFSAYIQIQNVGFFEHLGWTKMGESVMYHGVCHEKMTIAMHPLEENKE